MRNVTAFTATVGVIRSIRYDGKYEGRLGNNPSVCDRVKGDVVLFFGGGLKLYWEIISVSVFDSASDMLTYWGFKNFIPWVNSFESAIQVYCCFYTKKKDVSVVKALAWDRKIKYSCLQFYAWQGYEVANPKVLTIFTFFWFQLNILFFFVLFRL